MKGVIAIIVTIALRACSQALPVTLLIIISIIISIVVIIVIVIVIIISGGTGKRREGQEEQRQQQQKSVSFSWRLLPGRSPTAAVRPHRPRKRALGGSASARVALCARASKLSGARQRAAWLGRGCGSDRQ